MATQQTCTVDAGAVIVRVSAGEFLEYRIPSASQGVEYALVDDDDVAILTRADCAPGCTRRWPANAVPPGNKVHTLGLQFFEDGQSLEFEIDRKAADGTVLAQVLRCRYDNHGGADEFFDPLEVAIL